MPRSHGRVMATIWNDPDFIALEIGPQRLYLFLLSQPDLSHAGLVPMRVKRWAKKVGGGYDADAVCRDLAELEAHRFVVTDEDTEEVLVRTFVRNDGVYKQPKVMVRLREDAQQIESPRLRAAFRTELDRLPLHELSTSPTGRNADGPSTREAVEGVVDALRSDFRDAADYPSARVSDTPSDTPRVRACAFPQPPTPSPHPPSTDPRPPRSSDRAEPRAPRSETEKPPDFEEFWDTYDHKVGRKKAEQKWKLALRKPGVTADLLIAAAASYIDWQRSEGKHPEFTKHPATWLNGEHWTDERVGRRPPQTRVQEHLTLVQQLAAEEAEQERQAPREIGHRQ